MNETTVEKFASLFANCAVSGNSSELRKEAAAHQLVKQAEGELAAALPWLLPIAGAGVGGLAGYFGTEDEKRKRRNALYGALTGGLLGAGTGLMSAGNKITSDAAAKMTDANKKFDENNTAIVGEKSKPFYETWGIGKDTTDGPFDPKTKHPFSVINPHNYVARAAMPTGGYFLGGLLGSGAGSAIDRARNNADVSLANRRAIIENRLGGGGSSKRPPQQWQTNARTLIDDIGASVARRPVNWTDRGNRVLDDLSKLPVLRKIWQRMPRAQTGPMAAARDALGARAWQNSSAGRGPQSSRGWAGYLENLARVRALADAGRTGAAPTLTPTAKTLQLAEAIRQGLKRRNQAGDLPPVVNGNDRLVPRLSVRKGSKPRGAETPTPRTGARSGFRAAGRLGGGAAGTIFSHPYFVENFLNWLYDPKNKNAPPK